MTEKIDFKKSVDAYQAVRDRFRVIDVPDARYLMIDGAGDPNTSPAYQAALESLYPLAYTLKFASKRTLDRDYVVPPLEGLWWADDLDSFTVSRDKSRWRWTMMIMTPDWIDQSLVDDAVAQVVRKGAAPRLDDVRWEMLQEGLSVQTLHIGSYDDEAAVLERMHHSFVPENGLRMTRKHHEIYLSDPRKTAAEKRRTILRQPVERM